MSELEHDDQPLQPWIRAALLAEGLEGGPSPDQRSRMAGKLALAVGVPVATLIAASTLGGATVGGTAGAAVGSGAAGAAGAAGSGAAATAGAGSGAAATGATGATTAISAKAAALVVGALLVGGVGGVTLTELRHRSDAPRVVDSTSMAPMTRDANTSPVDMTVDDARSPVDAIDSAVDTNRAPTDASGANSSDAHHTHDTHDIHVPTRPDASTTTAAADQLARERELIDVARSALRAGDTRLATKSLVEHELRFPTGKLSEERRALAIEVAVAKGDRTQAARLAAEFRRDFPHSVFQTRIDELLK